MIETLISKLRLDRLDFTNVHAILEVGSRDGRQAVELSKIFPSAQVLAIEGNPDTIGEVFKNIKNYPNIKCVQVIVNDYDGKVTFYKIDREKTVTPHLDGNPGASSLYLADPQYPFEKYVQTPIEVDCKTLDTICNQYQMDRVDLIWIDLQGAEIKALKGLGKRLDKVQYIWAEVSHIPLYKDQPLFPEFDEFMREKGFELVTPIHPLAYFEDALYRRIGLKPMPKNAVTISQPWGGLGDNLQFSTLPELFSQAGRSVFISSENICRGQEIEDLVWGSNPFIQGISTQSPNAGSTVDLPDGNQISYIKKIELSHGFKATNISPKIFFAPNLKEGLKGKILIDLSASGLGGGDVDKINKAITRLLPKSFISKLFAKSKLDISQCLQIKFSNFEPNKTLEVEGVNFITCNSLQEYCEILYSCETLVTVHSGAHSLAVAMRIEPGSRLQNIFCIVPRHQYDRGLFIYEDVEYLIT